jgi:outer membrane protein IcsA
MHTKIISTTVTNTVVLGAGNYGTHLTITSSGAVEPTADAATAISAPESLVNVHILNEGTIIGAYGTFGGTGIDLACSGAIVNTGSITGGAGAYKYNGNGYGGSGGIGVDLHKANELLNKGIIQGGSGGGGRYDGGNGGTGVVLAAPGHMSNTGTITGGYGGFQLGYNGNRGGAGGGGVMLSDGANLNNNGTITGGQGGSSFFYTAGAGGAGVDISVGATLTNHGSITGGRGDYGGRGSASQGGDGVFLNGGELIAMSGIISGGTHGGTGDRRPADAVKFGSKAATLVVYAKAQFDGKLDANSSAADTLVLAGTAPGTLSGFGTRIQGFTTIGEDAGAHWTLDGAISGSGALSIGTGATLHLDGAIGIASIVFGAGGQETLKLDQPTQVTSAFTGFGTGDVIDLAGVKATSLNYDAGTLTLLDANNLPVDTLIFAGTYMQSDFALQAEGSGTELLFVGNEASHFVGHLPDFLPPEFRWTQFGDGVENVAHLRFAFANRPPIPGASDFMPHVWHPGPFI